MAVLTFPTAIDDFDKDDRISFSKVDHKYVAVHEDDGTEYEFDPQSRTWLPLQVDDVAEDDADQRDQLDSLDAAAQAPDSTSRQQPTRKRKQDAGEIANDGAAEDSTRARPAKKAKAPPPPRQNTAVYVTGLPHDATSEEIHELF